MSGHIFHDEYGHVFDDEFEEWLTERSGPWMPLEDSTDAVKEARAPVDEVDEKPQPDTDA
jgi:hypothetical protein